MKKNKMNFLKYLIPVIGIEEEVIHDSDFLNNKDINISINENEK